MIGKIELKRRFGYHPPRDEVTKNKHETMRNTCLALAELLDSSLPDGREKAMAIQHLEITMFFANAAIARPPAKSSPM